MNGPLARPDPMLQGRVRLGVLAWLAGRGATAFTEIAAGLEIAQGVLSVQLRQLEEIGYVRLDRGFVGRRPRTTVVLTQQGRTAYDQHLDAMMRCASGDGA